MNPNEHKKKELQKILNLLKVKEYKTVIINSKSLIKKFPNEYIF